MSANRQLKTDKIYKLTKEVEPNLTKDLYVTGGHGILVDEISEDQKTKLLTNDNKDCEKIGDKYLLLACVDERFEEVTSDEVFDIYHICLENEDIKTHYGIWANGILSESISEVCF
jgi:hypothetical protein